MDEERPISEHLRDLRRMLLWMLVPLGVVFFGFLAIATSITKWLLSFYGLDTIQIVSLSPFENMVAAMKVSGFLTLVLLLPLCIYALYRFTKPAIPEHHQRSLRKLAFGSLAAGLAGLAFGVIVLGKEMFFEATTLFPIGVPMWGIDSIINIIMVLGISCALMGELVVIIPVLDKVGIVKASWLAKGRPWVFLAILGITGFITPGPDPVSNIVMTAFVYGAYELGLLFARFNNSEVRPWKDLQKSDCGSA